MFSGMEAFKKAKELQELVAILNDFGVDSSRIRLRNVRSSSQTFAVFKSSSARYSLTIAAVSIDLLSTVIRAIAGRKNAELSAMGWNYDQLQETRSKLREQALVDAKAQAVSSANVLGVKLLGIHSLTDAAEAREAKGDFDDDMTYFGGQAAFAKTQEAFSTDLEFSSGNSKRVVVDIQVQFRVASFEAPA